MAIDKFDMGEDVALVVEFKTPKDAVPPLTLTDPAVVTLNIQKPDKTTISESYGLGVNIVKVSTGIYKYILVLDQDGTYNWRWRGNNGVTSAGVVAGKLDSIREPNF